MQEAGRGGLSQVSPLFLSRQPAQCFSTLILSLWSLQLIEPLSL